jgi:hypothetical protein
MTQETQREVTRVLAEMVALRFAHLVIKPVLTLPAKSK